MRLRTWLDSLAHRHASTRSPKKRRSHGPKATTHKTYAAYQSLASETLEPRQLLTATSGSTDLEDVDFTQAVQLTDLSSESGENSTDTSGSLSGFKWHDANGNGAWDSGEAGLADWTIYIDANENGALDSGELSTTTDSDGSYRFEGLAPGNYTIGETQQEGWQQTYPDSLGNAAGSSVDTSNLSTPEILVGAAYTDSELIVKLRDEASAPGVLGDLRSLQKTVGGTTLRAAEDLGFELWSIEGDVKDAIAQWGDNPSFQYIQPNYTITVDATVPNDTEFDRLWGLHNTGQTGGVSDADIDAVEAWDLQTGGNVVVGVIDTGIDYTHPDLVANIWTNPGEIAGNNIDDDGNGYIDDIHGYDFAYGDGDPMDVHSHGTHVAGTIAASGNNAQGVVGVNWNAQLMALKFLNDNGSGSTFAAIQAVEYATMMDVRVTNNSWGGGGYSQALYNAIAAAGEHDALFVAAAGNSGSDNDALPHYPSNYDLNNVISVASTTHTDSLSGFSSYGATTVDLAAPGSSIYSTVPYGRYAGYSGTSMATPHVAGVVAMVMAEDPSLSAAQVKQVILDSVDPLASLDGKVLSGGRLNAYNALQSLRVPGTHNVDLAEGQQITGLHFGGWVLGPATVSGFSFGDQNDDGLRGQDENGLSGWTVFLDTNDDGLLNAGEASVVTDSTGYYAFTDLSPGSYAVTQRSKPNWTQTTPTATTEYSSAEIEYGWQEISGIGTQVSLGDDQSQAISLPFEFDFYGQQKTSVSISSNGYLTFGGDGTDHTNDPIPHTAQPNDLIAAFWDDLNPTQGGDIYYYHDIAESRLIVQYENIPHYSSGGTYTFEAMLYANGNIEYHYKSIGGSHSATVGIENADASNGLQLGYNDSFASSGKAVRVTPAVNVARPHVVTVTWNAVSENHNFGNLFVTPGTLAGAAWADENNDGNWDSTEATLADIVIYLDLDDSGSLTSGDQQTTTDTAGNYQFITAAGTYDIRAVAPPNRTVTAPADGVHDAISVLHGGAVENLHFGFAPNLPGSLSGFKWHDVDGDRTWDSEEVGLAGWTIYLDTNENGALDLGEASTTTAGDGSYRFEGVQPGTYSIGEVLQEGWQQTYPDAMGGASDLSGTNLTTDDPFQTLRVPERIKSRSTGIKT